METRQVSFDAGIRGSPEVSLPSQRMNGGASPGKSIMSIISSCVRMSSPRPRSVFEVQETKRNFEFIESRLAYAQLQSQSQFSFVIAYLTFHFREKSMPRCFGKILETWKHIPLTLSLRKICPMSRPWSDGWSLNILPSWWVLRRRTSLFPDLVNAFLSNFKVQNAIHLRGKWSSGPDLVNKVESSMITRSWQVRPFLSGWHIYKIYFGCGW